MSAQNVLALYESVAEVTNQMLQAAKQQDWDKLSELEGFCANYVDQIKEFDELEPLSREAYSRKLASIKQILANDKEIRNLMAPWMVKLNTMLNSSKKNKYTRSDGF